MPKPVPLRYLPDLHIKTTLLHKPIVHFRTENVRLQTIQTAASNSGLVPGQLAGPQGDTQGTPFRH